MRTQSGNFGFLTAIQGLLRQWIQSSALALSNLEITFSVRIRFNVLIAARGGEQGTLTLVWVKTTALTTLYVGKSPFTRFLSQHSA